MLKHTRIGSSMDTARLGAAVAGPGLDTRTWVSLAVVNRIVLDPDEGIFVDVTLMPLRKSANARLGVEYAGNGFGLYAPLDVDDEVLVEAPNGDPDEGLVVTRRLFSASDPPPQEALDHPMDFLLVARPDKTVRIMTVGGGQVQIYKRGGSPRRLAFKDELDAAVVVFNGHVHTSTTPGDPTSTTATTMTRPTGTDVLRAE